MNPRFGRSTPPVDETPEVHKDRVEMYRVAYEEGKRALDDQASQFDSLRLRTVQVLALTMSATGFLVGAGVTNGSGRPPEFFGFAVAASAISLVALGASVVILLGLKFGGRDAKGRVRWWWPVGRTEFYYQVDPGQLVAGWLDGKSGIQEPLEFYRNLALHYQGSIMANLGTWRRVYRHYIIFVVASSLQVISWALLVWRFA